MGFFNRNAETKSQGQHNNTNDDGAGSSATAPSTTIEPMKWRHECPEFDSNFISKLCFLWLQPIFSRAAYLHKHGKALQVEDLAPLPAIDHSDRIEQCFMEGWNAFDDHVAASKNGKKNTKGNDDTTQPSTTGGDASNNDPDTKGAQEQQQQQALLERRLRYALWHLTGRRIVWTGAIKLVNTCLQFSFPLLLNAILSFFEETQQGLITADDPPGQRYKGYWLSALLLLAIAAKAITESAYFHSTNRNGWLAKSAVSAAVYSKSLRLASAAQHGTTLGEMVNLMQVDATKIEMFTVQINVLWDGIVQIAGYMTILGTLLGWPCVTGLVVMMGAAPVMKVIMGRLMMTNRRMVQYTDNRVKTTNEALQGIRSVKMYTWEQSFAAAINSSRDQELECLRTVSYLRGGSRAYMTALPAVAAVLTFVVYAYGTNQEITASILFASLVAFDQLRFPLLFYPMVLASLVQAQVSVTRISKFLSLAELTSDGYQRDSDGDGEIAVEKATVYWSDPKVPLLKVVEGDSSSIFDDDTASVRSRRSSKSGKQGSKSSLLQDSSEHSSKAASDEEAPVVVYPKPVVKDLSLRIAPGELCAVIGAVGSGKSSICAAILNETCLADDGSHVTVKGRVAYVAQSAWILNQTIRENILFGMPYDETKYKKVIEVCQLKHDIAMLEDGDQTEIGEKGINLSGGQKQRISVARAAYSDANIIILDDPLSALDPEVSKQLFTECILDFMKGKTRLLVTNQLQCLPDCDTVVALRKGRVLEQGTYSDLMNDEDGEVQRLLKDLSVKKETKSASPDETDVSAAKVPDADTKEQEKDAAVVTDAKDAKVLTTKEEREIGAVKAEVYLKYIKTGGGYLLFMFVYLFYILSAGATLLTTLWASVWTADGNYERNSRAFYLGIYFAAAVLLGVVTFARSFMLTRFGIRASQTLHKNLLVSVLSSTMAFFDTTPTGRIMSRFSKDLFSVDTELAEFFDFFLSLSLNVLVTVGTIIFVTPWFGIALLPIGFVYLRIMNYFREVSRETKRLESLTRSPVYSQFSETLGGLSTVRAYQVSQKFLDEFEGLLDTNTRAAYNNKTADRWLSLRLEMIGAVIAGLCAMLCSWVVISGSTTGQRTNEQFASLAGLSLTYAISITSILNFVVRSFAQLEASMNACERVFYYSESIPQEAPFTADELEKKVASNPDPGHDPSALAVAANGAKALHPDQNWPSKGEIVLNHLFMRYREETPLVLKGLDVRIGGGERVGVVGRTGSGKSSLLLCLMRIVEPSLDGTSIENYEAPIKIDGVDTLRIGLRELRTQIGIIPQSPVLFSGTIRSNLDPFHDYTDEQIYVALQQCALFDAVMGMNGELLAPVAEYGENLSQGQRQLLCLGRALLRQCRVLLLDEATSSIDLETDREIQRTLREAFQDCTVLTIAHRVNTIMDSDQILVMKDGRASEFGPPNELLKDENSLFSDIVRHSKAEEK